MTPQVGDKVSINGMITLMRVGRWRKTAIGEAFGRITEARANGFFVVSVPDHGNCLIHKTAIQAIEREMTLVIASQPLKEAMEKFQAQHPGNHVNLL